MKINANLYKVLSQSGRTESYTYQLLNYNDEYIRDLENCQNFTLDYKANSDLKTSITLNMYDDPEINYLTDRIKIIMHIKVNDYTFHFPLGIYIISSPTCTRNGNTDNYYVDTRSVELYSKLKLYQDDKVLSDYVILKGENIDNQIESLLSTNYYNIPRSDKRMTEDVVYPLGTSKLEILNDLLNRISYTPLDVDGAGIFYSSPFVLPAEREIDLKFTDDSDSTDSFTVMSESFTEEINLKNLYNVFIGYADDVGGEQLTYVYSNSNSESEISTVNLHRNICTESTSFDGCGSWDDLVEKVKYWAAQSSIKYRTISFDSLIIPIWTYQDCLYIKNKKFLSKTIRTSFSIDSEGKKMTHNVMEAVNIDTDTATN